MGRLQGQLPRLQIFEDSSAASKSANQLPSLKSRLEESVTRILKGDLDDAKYCRPIERTLKNDVFGQTSHVSLAAWPIAHIV